MLTGDLSDSNCDVGFLQTDIKDWRQSHVDDDDDDDDGVESGDT